MLIELFQSCLHFSNETDHIIFDVLSCLKNDKFKDVYILSILSLRVYPFIHISIYRTSWSWGR